MRPVVRGDLPKNEDGTAISFKEYGEAKRFLIDRIGKYCSYCETRINANLAIEHVRPKSKMPELALSWDNFLLACSSCNSTKGDVDVVLTDYFWPDKDNTFLYFLYDGKGLVKIKPNLTQQEKTKATKTIQLTGLDKRAPKPDTTEFKRASDLRFEHRLEAWQKANSHLKLFENAAVEDRPQLILLLVVIVEGTGFWSIWMTVFENHPNVKQALVDGISGTNKTCFEHLA